MFAPEVSTTVTPTVRGMLPTEMPAILAAAICLVLASALISRYLRHKRSLQLLRINVQFFGYCWMVSGHSATALIVIAAAEPKQS